MARSIKEQVGVDPEGQTLEIPEPTQPATEEAEPSQPDWLDPKFESVEAQAKAYSDAQRAMSQAVERQRQSEQKIEELAARFDEIQQPPQQPQHDQYTLAQQYEQAMDNGDHLAALGIQAYVAQQAAEAKVQEAMAKWQPPQQENDTNSQVFAALVQQQVAAKYGSEWEQLAPQVGDLLHKHPYLVPEGDLAQTVEALSLVTDMVQAQNGASAQQAHDAGRQQKLLAQTMSGGSGRPDAQQNISAADAIQAAMRQVR